MKSSTSHSAKPGVSRRYLLRSTSILAACAAVGCDSDDSNADTTENTTFSDTSPVSRQEWKRREVHPEDARGWGKAHYVSSQARMVPETVSLFGADYDEQGLIDLMQPLVVPRPVQFTFWSGAYARKTHSVVPLSSLLAALGYGQSSNDGTYITARSQTREEILADLSHSAAAGEYRFANSFPSQVARDNGHIIFEVVDGKIAFYALHMEDYAARAGVKYFSNLAFTDDYQGFPETSHEDYLIDNLPVDRLFELL